MRYISKICNFTQKIKKLRKNENDFVAEDESMRLSKESDKEDL